MIDKQILFRFRRTARAARPEPHARLTAAVVSAEGFSASAPLIAPIEVELVASIVDITDDTLEFLQCKREVCVSDIGNALRVLSAARVVRAHAPSDAPHMDTLIERSDDLSARLNDLRNEEYVHAAR